jgi:hypothetical protein
LDWETDDIFQQGASSHFPLNNQSSHQQEEMADIPSANDTVSVHENQLQEGQVYYNPSATELTDDDKEIINRPRHWNDALSFLNIIRDNF